MKDFILTLSCVDKPGIVRSVASFLAELECNILDSAQYGDPTGGCFFMRVHFQGSAVADDVEGLRSQFTPIAERYAMKWAMYDRSKKPRALILVSKFDHCLHDLLYRRRIGELPCDIVAVASNHSGAEKAVAAEGLPFHEVKITKETKAESEANLRKLIADHDVELIILARYMQILSADFCADYEGRIINIHHSFLPSFKGARPYNQAYAHGVKLIGATAHFVTADLDEGPIIEQDVARVDHSFTVENMVAAGRDVERQVLSRAVRYYGERRILMNGVKTVIFK
ncbi:MAG: formyltetrahydrofolate deformylase [Sphingomonadales bacterium]